MTMFVTIFVCLFAVIEGLALLDLGVSPYSGDVFHEVRFAHTEMLFIHVSVDIIRYF